MENKKEGKGLVTVIVILTILLVCALGSTAYFYLKSNENAGKETVVTKSDKTDVKTPGEKETANTIIPFNGSKSLNSSSKDYVLACQGNAGIYVTVDSTQQELTFSFTPARVVEFYPLNWTNTGTNLNSSVIKFDKKIIDVFFGGMGQSSSGDTLFILLEDGTVEYIPIVHMFNHVQGAPVSYGKINGVTDVTKFVLSTNSAGNGVTTLALKSDGTFYDLWYALKDTGNY